MKINSELPLCMLDKNNEINEYDFVLFHLYISNEKYKQYYLNQRVLYPDRLMIFDNSAYEFFVKGEKLDMDRYVECIKELKPDMYILPDVLMDMNKTLEGTKSFISKYNIECSEPLAVLQGQYSYELLNCLMEYKRMGIKNIAIPFHNSFFKDTGVFAEQDIESEFMEVYDTTNDDILYAMGRVRWMRSHNFLFDDFKHIHLLGSHCPLEKIFYKDYDTMDTGYPVKLGIKGIEFTKETSKPDVIIDDFLETDLNKDIKNLIRDNIIKFKEL